MKRDVKTTEQDTGGNKSAKFKHRIKGLLKKKSKAAEFKWNMMQFRKDFEKGNGLGFLYYCTANIVKKFFAG